MKFSIIGVSFNALASWSQTEPGLGRKQGVLQGEIPISFIVEPISM